MRALLETTCLGRSFDQMRGWSIHCAERVLESSDRIEPEVAVLNRERVVHRWPLRWEWLADDAAAAPLWRDRLPAQIREVGGVAYAVVMPGWVADDGAVWVLDPRQRPAGLDEVVILAVGDRRTHEVRIGLVHHRPSSGIAPWELVRLGDYDPLLGPLDRALA
jgi:hypothetical protein